MYTRCREIRRLLKIKKIIKFLSIIISFILLNILAILNSVEAININSANIVSGGDCGSLLKYRGIVVKAYYAEYRQDGVSYPAYCLDKTKEGVSDNLSYSVSVQEAITDVALWRIIINGYPYKSIEELGCSNKEEAFTATKQAIYCYIHGNNPSDYQPIGEAGQRTLNALNKILRDGQNSQEMQISNTIKINREAESFKVDSINKNYLSKTYSVQAGATITNYKVSLTSKNNQLPEEIKITDLNNNPKEEFAQNEKFKIIIPIKNLTQDGSFKINIETKIIMNSSTNIMDITGSLDGYVLVMNDGVIMASLTNNDKYYNITFYDYNLTEVNEFLNTIYFTN